VAFDSLLFSEVRLVKQNSLLTHVIFALNLSKLRIKLLAYEHLMISFLSLSSIRNKLKIGIQVLGASIVCSVHF
jgi:hypothetical protein